MLSALELYEINVLIDDGVMTQSDHDSFVALLEKQLDYDPTNMDLLETIHKLRAMDNDDTATEDSLRSLDRDEKFRADIAKAIKRSLEKRPRSTTPPEPKVKRRLVNRKGIKDAPRPKVKGSPVNLALPKVCEGLPATRYIDAGGGGDCQFFAIGHILTSMDYPDEMTSVNFLRDIAARDFNNPAIVDDDKVEEAWTTTRRHMELFDIDEEGYDGNPSKQRKRQILMGAVRTPGNLFWGDDTTLQAIARYFDVRILVLYPLPKDCYIGVYGPPSAKHVLNLYASGEHFQVLYVHNPVRNEWVCSLDLNVRSDRDVYNSLRPRDVAGFGSPAGSSAPAASGTSNHKMPGAWVGGGSVKRRRKAPTDGVRRVAICDQEPVFWWRGAGRGTSPGAIRPQS
jgi:hypothetical protein